MERLKLLWQNWQLERERQRQLNAKLELLTDPTLLDRIYHDRQTAK